MGSILKVEKRSHDTGMEISGKPIGPSLAETGNIKTRRERALAFRGSSDAPCRLQPICRRVEDGWALGSTEFGYPNRTMHQVMDMPSAVAGKVICWLARQLSA